MSETRRMHFVPRTYLKYFAQEKGKDQYYIHALEKSSGRIFPPNIKNICVETDLYMLEGATFEERQMLETMYRELFEDGYDSVYRILTDETRDRITMEERYEIISFVVSMFYRNNIWNVGYNSFMDETLAKAYYASKANDRNSFLFGEKEVSIAGKSLEELQKENRNRDRQMIALTGIQRIFELTRIRVINDLVTVVKTQEELVTSDNPVTFRGEDLKQRPIPIDPNNTLSIPIDKYHLLQLRPWGHKLDNDITMLGRMPEFGIVASSVSYINNQCQFGQCEKFLLGTEIGIKGFENDPTGELFKKKMQSKFANRIVPK